MRLAEIMEKTGTTHLALAKAIGVGRSTVSHYIAGRTEPDIAALIKIADYFHVSIDYLVGRDVKPETPYTGDPIVVDPAQPVKLRVNGKTLEIILAEERDR